MKKVSISVLAFVLVLLFCSCGIPAQKRECFSIPENFKCSVSVRENGIDYKGELEKENGEYTLTVTSPDTVEGMEIVYENGEYSVYYSESDMSFLPEKSFFLEDIIEFIEDSSQDEEIDCEISDGKYIIAQNNWVLVFDEN